MDVIELNEAFAAQGLAVRRLLGLLGLQDDDPRVNPNGDAIALGYPLGASGARLVTTAINPLHRGIAMAATPAMMLPPAGIHHALLRWLDQCVVLGFHRPCLN